MEQTATLEAKSPTDSEYEAGIDNLISEMKRTRGQMADDQREIERLRAQTRVALAQLRTS